MPKLEPNDTNVEKEQSNLIGLEDSIRRIKEKNIEYRTNINEWQERLQEYLDLENIGVGIEKEIGELQAKIEAERKKLNLAKQRLSDAKDLYKEQKETVEQVLKGSSEVGKLKKIQPSQLVVPTNMPRFRREDQSEEPVDFLEKFIVIMEAYSIDESRYLLLFALCLDKVSGQWLEDWRRVNEKSKTWKDFEEAFIGHFQHPNAAAVWMNQLDKLKFEGSVQEYTDKFVRLVAKLNLHLSSQMAIYHYKKGLPKNF